MLKVISYGGLTFSPNYSAGLAPGAEWGLPAVQARTAVRSKAWPLVAEIQRPGTTISLQVRILGQDKRALRDALLRAFSPEDEMPKQLVVADSNGQNQRYVLAIAEEMHPLSAGKVAAVDGFAIRLRVHGDVRWRSVNKTTDIWSITASGQTRVVTNPGTDEAYPVIRIKPTSAKSGGYAYRRWVAVVWKSSNSATRYPVRIDLDTQALVGAGKMRADGNDLRVVVDGMERDRWLGDMNTTATKIWVNLDFQPAVPMTLKTAIPSSGSIASVEVNENISRMPESGILLIDSEAFVYTSKVNSERKFTGITRAAKGTSMAAHSTGTAVHWIQRDVWLMYGNPSATAPVTDDRYKPAFSLLSSTNSSWVYQVFNDTGEMRAAGWSHSRPITTNDTAYHNGCYTASQRTVVAGEYTHIGCWGERQGMPISAYWELAVPCGITRVQASGQKRRKSSNFRGVWRIILRDGGQFIDSYVSSPAAANTWETHTYDSGTLSQVAGIVRMVLVCLDATYAGDLDADTVTVTLNSSETPTATVGAEQGGYYLDCILENTTTGDAIRLTMQMGLNTELRVDCDGKTVTWLADGSRQMRALQVLGVSRTRWLRLAPGQNTLKFTDAGTTGVTVTTEFEPRWF